MSPVARLLVCAVSVLGVALIGPGAAAAHRPGKGHHLSSRAPRGIQGGSAHDSHPATLPYTGTDLWVYVAIGAGLLGAGVALRLVAVRLERRS